MWIGAALLGASAWLFERDAPARWTAPAIASILYLSLAGTVLTFTIYFWLLRQTTASRMSLISYVTPAIAMLLGGIVGRERITVFTVSGSALILAGVWLVLHLRKGTSAPTSRR
jgi:drug/metabolite transporter (DMT)-like permease